MCFFASQEEKKKLFITNDKKSIYTMCLHKQLRLVFRFDSKDSAGNAICGVHGQVIQEQQVKCSWGKESNDQSQSSTPGMMGNTSV